MITKDTLIDDLRKWLGESFTIECPIGYSSICLSSWFLDERRDGIDIYLRIEGDNIVIDDDGNTANDLDLSEISIKDEAFKSILDFHNIKINNDNELEIKFPYTDNFYITVLSFFQAITQIYAVASYKRGLNDI